MAEPQNERQKINKLKVDCEKLRDELTKIAKTTKRMEQRLFDVSAKERLKRVELSMNLSELQELDNQLLINRSALAELQTGAKSKNHHTAVETLEDLLTAANGSDSKARVKPAHLQLAVVYAAIKRLRRQAEAEQEQAHIAVSTADPEKSSMGEDDEARITVNFEGRSCVFGIDKSTRFIDVLKQACEYWSLPSTGVLLLDRNQDAYPNNDIIFRCPDEIPKEVALKQCQMKEQLDGIDMAAGSKVGPHAGTNELAEGGGGAGKKKNPKRNSVDCLKYTELMIYLLAWALYTVAMIVRMDVISMSALHSAVVQTLYETEFKSSISNNVIVFHEITTETEFWQWVEGPLKSAITTNGGNGELECPADHITVDTKLYGTNKDYGTICYSGQVYSDSSGPTVWARTQDVQYSAGAATPDQYARCGSDDGSASVGTASEHWCPGDQVDFNDTSIGFCNSTKGTEESKGYYYGNFSCLLKPGPALAYNNSFYDDAGCVIAGGVCDQRIGYYTLRRFNHLHGTAMIQQYRVKAADDACPSPFTSPSFLDIEPKECYAPFKDDPVATGDSGNFVNYTGSIPDECEHTAHETTQTLTAEMDLLSGPYYPKCSFNAKLPPDSDNFDAAIQRVKDTNWVDARTRALMVVANFYNPSYDVVSVTVATCEFTAGGTVNCISDVSAVPVVTSVSSEPTFNVNIAVIILLSIQTLITVYRTSQMGMAYFGFSDYFQSSLQKVSSSGADYVAVSRYVGGDDPATERMKFDGTKLNVLGVLTFLCVVISFGIDVHFANTSASFYENYEDEGQYSGFQFNNQIDRLYQYVDMRALSDLFSVAVNLRAFAVFFQFLQIFKYMTLHPQMMLLFNAVDMATTELVNVVLLIVIVMFSVLLPLWYMFATVSGSPMFRDMDSIYINFEIALGHKTFPEAAFFEEQVMILAFTAMYLIVLVVVYGAIVASILSEAYIYLLNRVCEDGYFWFALPPKTG